MKYSKYLFKIYLTNWISLCGIFIGTLLTLVLAAILGLDNSVHSLSDVLKSLLTLPLFFIIYGPIPIAIFLAAIIILDTLCFFQKTDYVLPLLLIEWVLIVLKPILWAFEYQYWLWIGLSLSLLATQWLRRKQIIKIQSQYFKI